MTITSILEYDKRKVLIQLDGRLTFPIYRSEVNKYRLIEGEEMTAEVYTELIQEVLPKRLKLRAMNLLQKRSYTREGLRRKLAESRYPEYLIEEALEYVAAYRYLDDLRYAEEYIRCYSENRSKRRIQQELFTKGITAEVAEKAWANYEDAFAPIDEKQQIMDLLRKKHFDRDNADRKEVARMMNFLYRKGYSIDSITKCMHLEDYETNLKNC